MYKVNKFSWFRNVIFALLPLLIIACGEGKRGDPDGIVEPGSAAKPYKELLLNDTGVNFYIDTETSVVINQSNQPKPQAIEYAIEPANFPGQDAKFGRDVNLPSAVGGISGFDFVKLDKDTGAELPENSIDFGCVKDRVTGLIWENKTAANKSALSDYYKLHDSSAKHTWYDPNNSTNGGDTGQEASTGACSSEVIATDTYNFVQAVNAENLCGISNWRIPTTEELRSLVDYSVANGNFVNPMVDKNFFPYIATTLHRWTSQTLAPSPDRAFGFHFHDGIVQSHDKYCKGNNATNYGNGAIVVSGVFP